MPRARSPLQAFLLLLIFLTPCLAQNAAKPDDAGLRAVAAELTAADADGRRREALERHKASLTPALARLLVAQGRSLSEKGSYDAALSAFRLAVSVAEAANDAASRVLALNNVGNALRLKGDHAGALEVLSLALRLAEASGDKEAVGRALLTHTAVYITTGDFAKALDYSGRGLRLAEESGNKALQGNLLNNIGNIYFMQGDPEHALDYFRRALALREATGDRGGLSRTLNNIGNIHATRREYEESLRYFARSKAIKEELGDRDGISMSLYNIANVHIERGEYPKALEMLRESLKIREELGARAAVAEALYGIGLAHYAQNEHAHAVEYMERAAALAAELGVWDYYWDSRNIAGWSLRALGKKAEAARSFEEAISTIERLRGQVAGGEQQRQRFFEGRVAPYRAMVSLLAAEGRPAEALSYAERAKARVLLDVLQSGRLKITKAMTAEELERERELNARITALNSELARERGAGRPDPARLADLEANLTRGRLEHEAFEAGLYAARPELRVRRGEARPLKAEEALALMPDPRTALLEFAVSEAETFLFVMTREGTPSAPRLNLKAYTIKVRREELAARAEEFRRLLARRDFGFQKQARELYDLLLKPAAQQLAAADTLVLVPDDALWNLPFQALQDEREGYLIERHAVSYAPSLTVLREVEAAARARERGGASLLAFGNPASGFEVKGGLEAKGTNGTAVGAATMGAPYAPLPEAERQVKALARLYGPARSKVYLGGEASEERVKREAGDFGVLQFATHAELNDSNPLYSHVVLSRGAGAQEDGLLEAREMMNLDLRAEMVVLSACESARGRIGAGEGVIGMSWALFVAGSPTTVVTQWKVESASATELMLDFHSNLRGGASGRKAPIGKAQALRHAALRLLKGTKPHEREFRHPFYWAGFVIVGDAR